MSNNTNPSFLSLVGQSIKTPIKTSVTVAQITLELAEAIADSKDAIVSRVKDVGHVVDFGLASIEVGTRAAISSALGRKVEKKEMESKESIDALAEELWMPSFEKKAEEVKPAIIVTGK